MSDFHYYEFRAVDRPLSPGEMDGLSEIAGQARIDSAGLVDVYHEGDFAGDPAALVAKCFDAFLYIASWGLRHLMFRLPQTSCREYAPYCADYWLSTQPAGDSVLVSFRAEEPADQAEAQGWMDALLPVRQNLVDGDFRALYLGWLRAVQCGEVGMEQPEPPLSRGLADRPEALDHLARFLGIDPDLLDAAAALCVEPGRQRTAGELVSEAGRRRAAEPPHRSA